MNHGFTKIGHGYNSKDGNISAKKTPQTRSKISILERGCNKFGA